MEYSSRYRLFPTTKQRESLDWTRTIVRHVHNHALYEFNNIPEDEGTIRQRVWEVRDTLAQLKQWWIDLNRVYSTVLQKAVERIRTNILDFAPI